MERIERHSGGFQIVPQEVLVKNLDIDDFTKEDILLLKRSPLMELMFLADKKRRFYKGNFIENCSIINAKSGLCSEDCSFCAQSSRFSESSSPVYPLKNKKDIVRAALGAKEMGVDRFSIVTSGNLLSREEIEIIANSIKEIKDQINIQLCASLGALLEKDLHVLKAAGLTRYHHNIETAPRFYSQIVSTHSFEQRVATIERAQKVGLEVCSGGILGLGETWEDRIDMAFFLKELNVTAVPLNFLIPMPGTPLENQPLLSCSEALKIIALFRIILKDTIIKIVAGRESVLKECQSLAFMSGANGMFMGGYLTVKGRLLEDDHILLNQIKLLWQDQD